MMLLQHMAMFNEMQIVFMIVIKIYTFTERRRTFDADNIIIIIDYNYNRQYNRSKLKYNRLMS